MDELREKLNELVKDHEISCEEVLELSRKLDMLILEYYENGLFMNGVED